jgi:hypothetical protein
MMRKLIMSVAVTAVAALPLAARADWNDVEQKGKTAVDKTVDTGKKAVDETKSAGKVVEQKTATTYKKGKNYAKTTTQKIHKE